MIENVASKLIILCLQRDSIVKNFRIGKIWVMIATDLMARGLDFKVLHKCVLILPTSCLV